MHAVRRFKAAAAVCSALRWYVVLVVALEAVDQVLVTQECDGRLPVVIKRLASLVLGLHTRQRTTS